MQFSALTMQLKKSPLLKKIFFYGVLLGLVISLTIVTIRSYLSYQIVIRGAEVCLESMVAESVDDISELVWKQQDY